MPVKSYNNIFNNASFPNYNQLRDTVLFIFLDCIDMLIIQPLINIIRAYVI